MAGYHAALMAYWLADGGVILLMAYHYNGCSKYNDRGVGYCLFWRNAWLGHRLAEAAISAGLGDTAY